MIQEKTLNNITDKSFIGLCIKHQTFSMPRSECLVCEIIRLIRIISEISYTLGEPNEMKVSYYDISCDDKEVINGVRILKSRIVELKKRLQFYAPTDGEET